MAVLVAINGWDYRPWVARFRAAMPDRAIFEAQSPFDPAAIHYATVWKPEPGLLARLPNLKVIFNLGAGVDALLADKTLPDVPLCRIVNPDLTARMSEYVALNALMHLRQVNDYRTSQQEKLWAPRPQPSAGEVRVGIMGMGVLGRDAAEMLLRLGFSVSGWSRSGFSMPGIAAYAGVDGLSAFLSTTDILVVLLPLTDETRGMLNRALFAQLARDGVLGGPVLINAGRGGLQSEADLLACLEDGTLHAASLDVFEAEPLPAASPLWSQARVIITPHVAADSMPDALVRAVVENIAGFERDGTLQDQVDRSLGY